MKKIKSQKQMYKIRQNEITRIKNIKIEKGITLLALVITIIVLLILAGITINAITSDNGIIQNALDAKERAEIDSEREVVEQATIQAMENNKRGNIVRDELQNELDKITGEGKTIVTADTEEGGYFVKFVDSGRIYKVSIDGDVTYLGKEDELITQADIIANPENDTTPKLTQQVDLTVKTPIEIEGAEYSLVYAWNQDKENAPEDTKFLEAALIGDGRIRTTTVFSSDTAGGDYYLWVRIVVGGIEKEVCFGPYTIRDHTTLIATSSETASTSGFLGNTEIQRGLIESINITTSLSGHSKNDENTWDVSQSQNGMYLAWYEDSDNDGYYEVTIAGDGGVVANSNSSYLFSYIGYGVENQEIAITGLQNLETGLVTNMGRMFQGCKVQQLNLNTFDTSNVTTLLATFAGCTNLTTLEVNDWDTSNVISMGTRGVDASNVGTFQSCSKLTQLNLSKWNTSNVVEMGAMFRGCSNLTNLDLSNFDTSNVVGMYSMFNGCTNLQSLNIQNFNTSKVTIMRQMFNTCGNLKELDVSSFNTSNVTTMYQMFNACSKISNLDVSKFNTSQVREMTGMFKNCNALTEIDVSHFDTSKVWTMSDMFNGCSNLKELDLSSFKTSNVTSMQVMFGNCNELTNLYINTTNFDTSKVTSMQQMFSGCGKLSNLDVSKFDTSNVTNMLGMFGYCNALTEIDVSHFDTSNVTDMSGMFRECTRISNLDLSNFNTDKVTNIYYMFYGCYNLKVLNISRFNTQNVTDWASMFTGVPTTSQITTNQSTKDWILDKFPNYTNITVVE